MNLKSPIILMLVLGLAALHCRHRLAHLPLFAAIVGCIGITLGAALARTA